MKQKRGSILCTMTSMLRKSSWEHSRSKQFQKLIQENMSNVYESVIQLRKKIEEHTRICTHLSWTWIGKIQYCEKQFFFVFCLFVCFLTRSNLEIQCNSHWNCSCILPRNGGENFNIPIEAHKTLQSQTNPKYEDQSWEYHHM